MYLKLIILSLASWFFGTVLIDFFVIPNAFRIVGDVLKAGLLGIATFSAFNKFEVLFGAVLVFSIFKSKELNYQKFQLVAAKILFTIAVAYYWYLTPKITELTQLLINAPTDLVKTDHHFFHKLYVKMDVAKLVLITALMVMQFIPKKNKQEV